MRAAHSRLLLLTRPRRCLVRRLLAVIAERRSPIPSFPSSSYPVLHSDPLSASIRFSFSHSPSVIVAFLSVLPTSALSFPSFLPSFALYRLPSSLSLCLSRCPSSCSEYCGAQPPQWEFTCKSRKGTQVERRGRLRGQCTRT